MGWRLGLTVLLIAVESHTKSVAQEVLRAQQSESRGNQASQEKLETMITNVPAPSREKVTTTVGSKHPPKHEIILNFPAPDDQKDLWKELDHMKMSSKFRNAAALGSSIATVRQDEGLIQNTDGANPRLPPFAFSEDSESSDANVVTTTVGPSAILPPVKQNIDDNSSTGKSTEIDSKSATEDEKSKQENKDSTGRSSSKTSSGTTEDGAHDSSTTEKPATASPQNPVTQSGKERTTTVSPSEPFDSIAEYNKWIAEKAAKRKQIRENGYKKYQQMMFKSGRNIVPVRLFFDTDPIGPPRKDTSEEFPKRVTSPTPDDKKVTQRVPVVNVNNSIQKESKPQLKEVKELKRTEPRLLNSGNTNLEAVTKEDLPVIGPERPTTLPTPSREQSSGSGSASGSSSGSASASSGISGSIEEDEIGGSGVAPAATSESQEDLLFVDSNRAASSSGSRESASVEKVGTSPQSPAPWVPNTSDTQKLSSKPADITKHKTPITSLVSSKPFGFVSSTAQVKAKQKIPNGGTTVDQFGRRVPTLPTRPIIPTTQSPRITVPIPVAGPTPANRTDTLPQLVSMPPLNTLKSFSSLKTPVDIATKRLPSASPPHKKISQNRLIDENRRKSSGVLGLKGLLQARNQKQKFTQHHNGATPTFGTVDSDKIFRQPTPKGRQPLDRSQFIKTRPSKIDRSQKKSSVTQQTVSTPVTRKMVIVKKTHTGQQVFETAFKINSSTTLPPKRIRLRAKPNHLVSNTPMSQNQQRGTATDMRAVPAARQQAPVVQLTLAKSTDQQAQKGGISLARGHQKKPATIAVARTLTPPLTPTGELKVIKPSTQSLFPIAQDSEWDRIRAEFLRIKRQHKKIYEMQRKMRATPAKTAGVRTVTASGGKSEEVE